MYQIFNIRMAKTCKKCLVFLGMQFKTPIYTGICNISHMKQNLLGHFFRVLEWLKYFESSQIIKRIGQE